MGKKNKKTNSQETKSSTLYVDGMHCASCEVLIERKLLKQNGIKSVDASLKSNKVEMNYVGVEEPDVKILNKEFKSFGYKFSKTQFKRDETPMFQYHNSHLEINPLKFKSTMKVLMVFMFLIIAFIVFEKLQLGRYISVDSSSSLPAFFVLGIVAGVSSCAALIGGLLLSMTKQWNELYIDKESKLEKSQPHFMFHSGRILAFAIFGGLLGFVGQAISFNNSTFFAILTIFVSIIMFILAMQMLGVEWAQRFKFSAPKSMTRFVSDESNFKGKYMPFALGAFTFFLPCGFTLIAQTVALASGTYFHGALIMLLFALGTFPTLLGISYSGLAFNSKPHLTAKFNLVAGLVIVFFVMYNINGQLNVLGFPSLSDFSLNRSAPVEETVELNTDGKQVLQVTAKGFEYIPVSSMTIKAGEPTTLIVDNQGIQGCGSFMAANGLINNFVALDRGINKIDLGSPSKGTYKLTCSMGMVPPVTITVV